MTWTDNQFNEVRCDTCGHVTVTSKPNKLPKGWIKLAYTPSGTGVEHLCPSCLKAFGK